MTTDLAHDDLRAQLLRPKLPVAALFVRQPILPLHATRTGSPQVSHSHRPNILYSFSQTEIIYHVPPQTRLMDFENTC